MNHIQDVRNEVQTSHECDYVTWQRTNMATYFNGTASQEDELCHKHTLTLRVIIYCKG